MTWKASAFLLVALLAVCATAQLSFFQMPADDTVVVGMMASFICQTNITTSGTVLQYFRNNELVVSGQNRRTLVMGQDGADLLQLEIANVTLADAGLYICRVTNFTSPNNDSIEAMASLIVLVPPVAVVIPSPTNAVINGNMAVFYCNTSSGTPPFVFAWSQGVGGVSITDGVVSTMTESSLTFPAVNLPDHNEMRYVCTVTLDRTDPALRSSSSASATLQVQVGPTIQPINDVTFLEGQRLFVQCTVMSSPLIAELGLMFVFRNMILPPSSLSSAPRPPSVLQEAIGSLSVRSVTVADNEGDYACRAEKTLVTGLVAVNETFRVTINIMPVIQDIIIDATIPLRPILECRARARPDATIIWFGRSGQRIISDPQGAYTITTTGPDANFMFVSQLQFNVNATPSDQGIYTCNATNTVGSDQRTTNLVITFPASMHAFPSVTALEGTHPVLVCSVMTSSVPTFQLFSSRGALISAIDADYSLSMAGPSNEFVYTVNVTFLRPVTREDMGTFNCVVDGTPLLSTSTLTVIVPPVATITPSTLRINETETAEFVCSTTDGTSPFIFQWFTSAGDITSGISSNSTMSVLTIPNAMLGTHDGAYSCNVTLNQSDVSLVRSDSAMAVLNISIPPNIQQFNDVTTVRGRPSLICVVRSAPIAVVTFINPSGVSIDPVTDSDFQVMTTDPNATFVYTSTLTFLRTTTVADEGNYTCMASNGFDTTTDQAMLTVNVAPTVTLFNNITVVTDRMAVLECRVEAKPMPTFNWITPAGVTGFNVQSPVMEPQNNLIFISRLEFTRAALSGDAGQYSCTGFNVAGNFSQSATLTVLVPPTTTVSPATLTINNTASAMFNCSASGTAPFLFVWTDPAGIILTTDLTPGPNSLALTLPSATYGMHEGVYQCNVTSDQAAEFQRSDTATGTLTIQVIPTIVAVRPVVIGVTGMAAKLAVNVTFEGRPAVLATDITWTRNGDPSFLQSAPGDGHNVTSDRLCLNFFNISSRDDGVYTVTACNPAGCVSTMIALIEEGPPMLITVPQNRSIDENQVQTFTCSATGLPRPNITWTLNGTEIMTGATFTIFNQISADNTTINSTLSFTAVSGAVSGNGQYNCVATNTQPPQAIASATLQVFTMPIIVMPPMPQNVIQGSTAAFSCEVTSIPRATITWYREVDGVEESLQTGMPVNVAINLSQVMDNSVTSNLVVMDSQLIDIANYRCRASHLESGITGMAASNTALLDIYVGPTITIPPRNLTVRELDSASFSCGASARPAPTFAWFFRMVGSDSPTPLNATSSSVLDAGFNMLGARNDTLVLNSVAFSMRGLYQCTAGGVIDSFVGTPGSLILSTTADVYLTVNVDVNITAITNPFNVTLPNSAMISCTASGFPQPVITWLIPGGTGPIQSGNSPNGITINETIPIASPGNLPPRLSSILTISSSMRVHNGTYTCTATSMSTPATTATATTDLTVLEVPDQPDQPINDTINARSVMVSWTAPLANNAPILRYEVNVYARPFGIVVNRTIVTDISTQLLINELLPFVTYEIRVRAANIIGRGMFSDPLIITTDQDVPTPPRDVQVIISSTSAVSVDYIEPSMPNGILLDTRFYVRGQSRFVQNGPVHEVNSTFKPTLRPANIINLMAGFNYTLTGFAQTAIGFSPASTPVVFTTPSGAPDRPTLPPRTVTVTTEPESDTLSWNLIAFPEDHGIIHRYQVIVVPLQESSTGAATLPTVDPDVFYAPGSQSLRNSAAECDTLTNQNFVCAYIAIEIPGNQFVNGRFAVTVGSGSVSTDLSGSVTYQNSRLNSEQSYTIIQRAFVEPDTARRRKRQSMDPNYRVFRSSPYYPSQRTTASASLVGPVVGGVIGGIIFGILLTLLIVLIVRRKRRSGKYEAKKKAENRMDMVIVNRGSVSDMPPGTAQDPLENSEPPKKARSMSRGKSRDGIKEKKEVPTNRGPIPVEKFAKHTQEMQATDGFSVEYDLIQQLSPKMMAAEACSRPENKLKNRYANIIAYDDSRVNLPYLNDTNTDYINANWLDGYKSPKEYIGTQGPVPQSIIDFWRMVWATKCNTIAMLTNLEENGRLKCNQYWPVEGGIIYGQLVVTLTSTVVQSHFTIRTFTVVLEDDLNNSVKGTEREVKQFHFTAWPDFGVPSHPTPLLTFWRRLRKHVPRILDENGVSTQPPMIVHCSAGVGRTGTLVVIDTMITQAKLEGKLDVFNYVMELRRQRNFIVQTEIQYRFIHHALVEYFSYDTTEVPVNDLRKYISKLKMESTDGESAGDLEFKQLSTGVPIKTSSDIASKPINKKKNRSQMFVPYDQTSSPVLGTSASKPDTSGRVTRVPQSGVEGSEYINASFIDNFTVPSYFIATQGPLQNTIGDFWAMVWKYECNSIVMLSNLREKAQEHSALYWPSKDGDPSAGSHGDMNVKFESESTMTDFAIRDFSITNTKEHKSRSVRQFHYIGWPERGTPENGTALLNMIGHVERHQLNSGNKPVVVHCVNGSGRTGAFIAISSNIDRAKSDNSVDVFQTVKMMRIQRMGCVQTTEQYMFVYNTIQEYISSFDTYSNFSP